MSAPRLESAIYEGSLDHCRLGPRRHAFRYRLFLLYLDLAELPRLFDGRWLWSTERPAPARFRRSDYPGHASEPLDESIRSIVERRAGFRPQGAVRLLTHLRYFGYGFNPASFFYCFDARGDRLVAVVVHVTNTPWGETFSYVVTPEGGATCGRGDELRATRDKRFHVSPFLPMDLSHEFRFTFPGPALDVHMLDRRAGRPVFTADLRLRRREIDGRSLASVLLRHPLMTARVTAGIYWQALRLWLKGVPYHPHPGTIAATPRTGEHDDSRAGSSSTSFDHSASAADDRPHVPAAGASHARRSGARASHADRR